MNSALYRGWVRHRRFGNIQHEFRYKVLFLWLDLDELDQLCHLKPWFAVERRAALSFRSKDTLDPNTATSSANVWKKVAALGGTVHDGRVCLLGQVRCLGFYFSPVNFFYCYDQEDQLQYLVAEVSNTPWNQRHCYLVDAQQDTPVPKEFHVSPFMTLDMHYRWRTPAPNKNLCLHIENHRESKVFDATLVMRRHPLSRSALRAALWQIPAMSWHILTGIYWQAFRLLLKRVPYVAYPSKESTHAGPN